MKDDVEAKLELYGEVHPSLAGGAMSDSWLQLECIVAAHHRSRHHTSNQARAFICVAGLTPGCLISLVRGWLYVTGLANVMLDAASLDLREGQLPARLLPALTLLRLLAIIHDCNSSPLLLQGQPLDSSLSCSWASATCFFLDICSKSGGVCCPWNVAHCHGKQVADAQRQLAGGCEARCHQGLCLTELMTCWQHSIEVQEHMPLSLPCTCSVQLRLC